jgi:flagellar M-ring protein FliF
LTRITSTWAGIPARKRVVVVAAAAVVFALLAGWTFFAGRPDFVVLYNQLEARDAASIVETLKAGGTPYRLADGGRTILVPSRDVHQLRLTLAGEGLPSQGTPGFELLDGVSIGATDFERRNSYIRALSGELARTIGRVAGVESARVHIVLPEQSLFTSQAKPTTAAVFVQHRPGARLAPDQVQGIIHLVARSVEGLATDMVTVVDESGRVLEGGGRSGAPVVAERAASQIEASRQFSRELESNLQRLMEQVLGPGNVAARVAAELSFDESVINRKTYEPVADGQGILRSTHETSEYQKGSGAGDGGAAGTQSNVPLYQAQTASASMSESERSEVLRNYEVNEIVEHTVIAPGTVRRLSVSVVVNRDLTPADAARLEKLVAAAVGSDPRRSDQIVITGMPFNTDLAKTVAADIAAARRNQLIVTGAGAGLALLLGLVLFMRARRVARTRSETPVLVAEEVAELKSLEESRTRAQEDLQRLFRSRPQSAAEVIRTWLVEE